MLPGIRNTSIVTQIHDTKMRYVSNIFLPSCFPRSLSISLSLYSLCQPAKWGILSKGTIPRIVARLEWYLQKVEEISNTIFLFHNYFSPIGEQPEQRILAYKSEQPTAGCMEIFHKYCCYIKHGGIITHLTSWNTWRHVIDVWAYGAWIRIYYILCSKTYGAFGGLFWSPAGSQQAARNARICETCSSIFCRFSVLTRPGQ